MTSAVVVGSGPNGLAAGATLAAAGVDVTVIEAGATIGGGTRSSELTLPGLLHDECSGFHPFGVDNAFTRSVDLAAHGLEWKWPDVQYSSPLDENGRGGAAYRSAAATAKSLGDDRWRMLFDSVDARFPAITEDFLRPLLHLPAHPVSLARFGARAALPSTALARFLRNDESRSLWAGVAAHAFRPLEAPFTSAIGMALGSSAHVYGWPVAAGGSQSIADAMAAVITGRKGQIETGHSVTSLAELGSPNIVMLDTSPTAAAAIVGDRMPNRIARAYRRYRHGPGAFKVDFAIEGGVPWLHEPSRRAGTVHVGGTFAEIASAERHVARGDMPDRPFVLVGQQYLADPSRSEGNVHPLYSYAHVPAGYEGDATEHILAQIERFAPGFRDQVVATHVRTTTELSRYNANYVGGDIATGANTVRQIVFRPRITANPYSTGVDGVYLCSAATPPGAGAHGMCGYNAATAALRALDLD